MNLYILEVGANTTQTLGQMHHRPTRTQDKSWTKGSQFTERVERPHLEQIS